MVPRPKLLPSYTSNVQFGSRRWRAISHRKSGGLPASPPTPTETTLHGSLDAGAASTQSILPPSPRGPILRARPQSRPSAVPGL
eukprot:3974881-Prymnesium_polylepis.1